MHQGMSVMHFKKHVLISTAIENCREDGPLNRNKKTNKQTKTNKNKNKQKQKPWQF